MKTRKLIIIIIPIMLIMSEPNYCQTTFKKYIDDDWYGVSNRFNILVNGKNFNLFSAYETLKIDSIGNILSKSYILEESYPSGELKEFVLRLNDSLIFFASRNHNSFLTLSKLDLNNFNFLIKAQYLNLNEYLSNLKFGKENIILVSGRVRDLSLPGYKNRPSVAVIDSNLNKIIDYSIRNRLGISRFCFETNDHYFIIGMTTDTVGACIAKIDTLGNIIWAKSYFRPQGMIHTAIENSDGTYTIWGSLDSGTYNTATNFLMKIDTSGQVLWCKHFGDSILSFETVYGSGNLTLTDDGGYAITGTITYFDPALHRHMIIIKTDANGDTLWTRCHGVYSIKTLGTSIHQTSDGGYIVAGASSSPQFTNGGMYVVKTDSLGMTASHCEEFNLPIPFGNITVNDSNIFLVVDTGFIQQGASLMHDSVAAIPQNMDGCWLLGIEDNSNIMNQKFNAFPNPTHGVFTLKNNIPNPVAKTFIVYDIFGHELFTMKDVVDSKQQLDLSSKPPGMYYVKIIEGDKVEVVKVVVQ